MKIAVTVAILLASASIGLNSANAASGVIEKNGYYLALKWQLSGEELIATGMIKNGKPCKRLNVSLHMKNNHGNTAYITETINYQVASGTKFKGKDRVYSDGKIRSSNAWSIQDVYLQCKEK